MIIVVHGSAMVRRSSATTIAIVIIVDAPPPRHAIRHRVPQFRSYPIHGMSRRGGRSRGDVERAH